MSVQSARGAVQQGGHIPGSRPPPRTVTFVHKSPRCAGIPVYRRQSRRERRTSLVAAASKASTSADTAQELNTDSKSSVESPWLSGEGGRFADLILDNYQRIFGEPLVNETDGSTARESLWDLDALVYAHDHFCRDPAQYTYGNKVGLSVFEASWDEFVGTESRKTTSPSSDSQNTRNALLRSAGEKGFKAVKEVARVSLKGRPLYLRNGHLFNLEDKSGRKVGQAVHVTEWTYVDEESEL